MSYAVITGGSKGIGLEIARELAKRSVHLILIARSESELNLCSKELKSEYKIECLYLVMDLAQKDAPEKIFKWVSEKNIQVNILVNNAGYALWGSVEELEMSAQEEMMMVNMVNLVKLTRLFINLLKKNKEAFILNVSSTAGYQAISGLNVYAASKAFVRLFSRALRKELASTSISVSCLSPGTTSTNFMNRAQMTTPEMINRASKFTMPADVVAKFAVEGMFKKKNEMIPGFLNKFSVALIPFIPKWITEKIAKNLYKK